MFYHNDDDDDNGEDDDDDDDALSDSFSASIISDLNYSNEDIQNPKLEHYAALATYFLGAKVSTIIFCEVSFRLSQSIDLNIL